MNEPKQWTLSVIDFANEPKEYVWWINVPPIERLRAIREITEMIYVFQQRPERDFQPLIEVIKRKSHTLPSNG